MQLSFRWRLFLALTLAVIVGTTVDAVVDYFEKSEIHANSDDLALDTVQGFALAALDFSKAPPTLVATIQALPGKSQFRLLRQDEVLHELSNVTLNADLAYRQTNLPGNYRLELAVDPRSLDTLPGESLRQDLTDDGPQIILSVLIAWGFSLLLLRPVVRLNRAINDVSQQRFPVPVSVPPGNDALAQLASSFNRMSANIQAAFDRERAFTRYASHELRTPLSAMKVQLEALEMGLSEAETVVPAVQRNLNRMQRVLEALLSLARASEQNHEPVAVEHLIKEAVALLPEGTRYRVVVEDTGGGGLKVVQPYLMGQCIFNLIDNALKYSDGTVELSYAKEAGNVVINVRDEGGGVPDEVLDKITHIFFRLSDHVEGSGLGLAFVKHIVRTFGGDLTLENTSNGLEARLKLIALEAEPAHQ